MFPSASSVSWGTHFFLFLTDIPEYLSVSPLNSCILSFSFLSHQSVGPVFNSSPTQGIKADFFFSLFLFPLSLLPAFDTILFRRTLVAGNVFVCKYIAFHPSLLKVRLDILSSLVLPYSHPLSLFFPPKQGPHEGRCFLLVSHLACKNKNEILRIAAAVRLR